MSLSKLIFASLRTMCVLFAVGTFSFYASAQSLPGADLDALRQLSPQAREDLLRAVVDSSDVTQEQQLQFPEVVRPLGGDEDEEQEAPQLYDQFGRPLLDDEERPIRLTDKLLDAIASFDTQNPDDWLDNETPFFEQEIELKPFGYELFAGVPTTFAPATDIPVPPEYRLGPGDTIEVQLFGKENRQYSLVVRRDGTINFPNIGPVSVIGMEFDKLKQDILDRVAEQLIGTSAAINMGSLRSVQVLVLGDARRPGAYTVSGLSTITNALFVSGGVKEIGSLRNIQLKRSGKLIRTLDLYDLLLTGDSRDDVRLESGDVIFVPTIGRTVGVGGFVKRPAVYELKSEKSVGELLSLAGGLRADAYPQASRIERFDENQERSFINLNLLQNGDKAFQVAAGDTLLVPPILLDYSRGIRVRGLVKRPGIYEWKSGARLTDVISGFDRLKSQADAQYVLVRRELEQGMRIAAVSANLAEAINSPQSEANILLQPRDEVWVFGFETIPAGEELVGGEGPEPTEITNSGRFRTSVVRTLLDELRLQATPGEPFQRVTIGGLVRVGGNYPYEAGMRVSTLVRAGAGLAEPAYPLDAELTRYSVVDGTRRVAEVININVQKAMQGDPQHDISLQPWDFLSIRRLENWSNVVAVSVQGEVRFPGRYSASEGETIADLIERAGGLTDRAFPEGSVFLRTELREREQQQLNRLKDKLTGDLALLSLQSAGSLAAGGASALETQSAARGVLAELDSVSAVGRLVIDLPGMLSKPNDMARQVFLKNGDELIVPDRSQEVTIIGEVFFPTSHVWSKGLSRDDYVQKSGGLTPAGSQKNIYVVKANGAVLAGTSRFFSGKQKIEPGDTIVVPLDTGRGFRLQAIASATSIVYNLAIAAAAINGLSN